MARHWEIDWWPEDSEALGRAFIQGWEPFAVSGESEDWRVWVRRLVDEEEEYP